MDGSQSITISFGDARREDVKTCLKKLNGNRKNMQKGQIHRYNGGNQMNLRSKELYDGLERAAHRALLYSVGFTGEDFGKPLVAVVNSWNEIVPGHIHLRSLAEAVKGGIREGGGIPIEFHTIAICDGLCQGHMGMRYPLPSREVIADSIELMVESHRFDAMVMLCSCDKIVPGHIMAALRINIPAIIVTGGPMYPGRYGEFEDITLSNRTLFPG